LLGRYKLADRLDRIIKSAIYYEDPEDESDRLYDENFNAIPRMDLTDEDIEKREELLEHLKSVLQNKSSDMSNQEILSVVKRIEKTIMALERAREKRTKVDMANYYERLSPEQQEMHDRSDRYQEMLDLLAKY
jgi:hypothetical protein